MNAWRHAMHRMRGLFIALIVVHRPILGRARGFAGRHGTVGAFLALGLTLPAAAAGARAEIG